MSSESDFLDWIRAQQRASDLVRLPAGDDLAVLSWNARDLLIVGVDQVLDSVHFDSSVHDARAIGRKAMNRNLSDCAAMGCLPVAVVVSAALPRNVGIEFAKEMYLGLREAGNAFDCAIVGGDTGSWDGKLAVSVTIIGKSDGVEPITRSGAKVGDGIYITGALGGSILGRHMTFTPRVREGRALARTGLVTSMIDLSDGLSRDLPRICQQSSVGANIESQHIPIHPDAIELSKRDGDSPLDHALHDGEDYELLFTAKDGFDSSAHDCTRIGEIVAGSEVQIRSDGRMTKLSPRGWDHRL